MRTLPARLTGAAQSWRPGARVVEVRPLPGGASSLTFAARLAEGPPLVVKVAPPGLAPVRNRDVLRQARVLNALRGAAGVAVPAVRFTDPGAPPAVPPLVAMDLVEGECVEPVLADEPPAAADVHARGLDAARMLGALHRLSPEAIGLGDEPVVSPVAEVERWTRAFDTVPGPLRGEYARCAAALTATVPPPLPAVVTHGDYRLGNMLCVGGRVAAVIDWEIWAVGDPRGDVTWFTALTDEERHPGAPSTRDAGTPTVDELLRAYGSPVPDLAWFQALSRYKEAAVMALLIKRGWRNGTPLAPAVERMVPALPTLLDRALSLLDS